MLRPMTPVPIHPNRVVSGCTSIIVRSFFRLVAVGIRLEVLRLPKWLAEVLLRLPQQ